MRSFKTPLVVEVMPSGKNFRLYNSFVYYWKRGEITIRIPKGFVSDFASIPTPFRLFIPKLGRYNKAAVLHDAVYQRIHGLSHWKREQADLLFLDAMTDLKVKKWKRYAMYKFVRIFGWLAWRER